jgi:aldose 1-epimerase
VLGHSGFEPYLRNTPYFGAIIGRYANRIASGRFVLGGNEYQLVQNDGPNHLVNGPSSVELRNDAVSEAPTIVNLTQHTYFNLTGEPSTSVLEHELTIHASYYTPVSGTLIPTGQIASVDGTAFDLRQPVLLRQALRATHPQLGIAGGFDHNFILQRRWAGLVRAATLHDPRSGRVLQVSTRNRACSSMMAICSMARRLTFTAVGSIATPGFVSRHSTILTPPITRTSRLSNCGPTNVIARRQGGSF